MNKKHLNNFYTDVAKDKQKIFGLSVPIMLIHKHLLHEGSTLIEKNFNLSQSEIDVLTALFFNGKVLTPTELYEATILSSGGMTKILKKLQEKNYIERIPSTTDKRSLLVQLTKEGKVITEKSLELFFKKDTEAFGVLNEGEQEVLFKLLKKVVYSLRKKE